MPCATAQSQRSGLYINTTALTRPLAAGCGVLGALGLSGAVASGGPVLFGGVRRIFALRQFDFSAFLGFRIFQFVNPIARPIECD